MTVIVEDINARVAVAREHVVRGELPSAASNFRDALFLVDRHLETVNNSYLHGRWVSCKEALKEEAATAEAGAKLASAAQQQTPKASDAGWAARATPQHGSDYSPMGSPVPDSIPAGRVRRDDARAEAGSPAGLPYAPRRVSCTPEFAGHTPSHQQPRRMARTPSEPARSHTKAPFGLPEQEASPAARPFARAAADPPARHPHEALQNPMFGRPGEAPAPSWSHTSSDHDPEVWQNCLREPWSRPKAPSFRKESPGTALLAWLPPGSRRQSASAGLGREPAARVDTWRDPKDRPGAREGTPGAREGTPGAARLAYDGPDKELADALIRDLHISNPGVAWDDIAGLDDAKRVLQENVILPLLMPDYFQGIRRPVKGVLLFGPPGTGKTMLAKAVATECNTTFFNVSAATLGSKYRGESERMVRALFDLARERSPTVIFFDEIDALCSTRGAAGEHEASRRVKTELLVQIDGIQGDAGSEARKSVMVMAATNCPWDLDEALRSSIIDCLYAQQVIEQYSKMCMALGPAEELWQLLCDLLESRLPVCRRLEKRIYIPLPEQQSRSKLLSLSMKGVDVGPDVEFERIAARAAGYSGDDLTNVCRDAALNGMRRKIAGLSPTQIRALRKDDMQEPVHMADFEEALRRINPSVLADVVRHEQWMKKHGAV